MREFSQDHCPPGKQWARHLRPLCGNSLATRMAEAFLTFVHPEDAQAAKDATDMKLKFPESERACDVMLAKNQGRMIENGGSMGRK